MHRGIAQAAVRCRMIARADSERARVGGPLMNTAVVIFDWDGTLYNSSYLLDEAILAAHRNLKLALSAAVSLCLFDSSIDGTNKLRRALEVLPKQMQLKLQREIAADFIRRERAAGLFPDVENL